MGMLFLLYEIRGSVVQFPFQIMIDHRADGRIRPDVFSRFDHINDGVNRQDKSHDANGGAGAAHEGEREEEAAHRDAGVSDGRQDGNDDPGNERR